MIKNDLHVHSIHSLCGMHTVLEIVEIAAEKDMELVNICDHGSSSGKNMNFGVITDERRWPKEIISSKGESITVLSGIEANILDINGNSDFPTSLTSKFDLVSAGFHHRFGSGPDDNTKALERYLHRFPLDILTHPCKQDFPLILSNVVELSLKYGFALEVNNTNLCLGKTDLSKLEKMIRLAHERCAILVENSDGHTFLEIGENNKIEEFVMNLNLDKAELFMNRDIQKLKRFLSERKKIRR